MNIIDLIRVAWRQDLTMIRGMLSPKPPIPRREGRDASMNLASLPIGYFRLQNVKELSHRYARELLLDIPTAQVNDTGDILMLMILDF